jgi:hypothetical protein
MEHSTRKGMPSRSLATTRIIPPLPLFKANLTGSEILMGAIALVNID